MATVSIATAKDQVPLAALRPCPKPGCHTLTAGGRCPEHRKQLARQVDQGRGTRTQRGYSNRWLRAAKRWRAADPMRQFCRDPFGRHGRRLVLGNQTDHIVPHRGDRKLFWDRSNWQTLCEQCHGRKTREGG